VYVAEGACGDATLLSPGRKTVATFLGGTYRFLDAATGALKGTGEVPASLPSGKLEPKGAAFLPDGSALAADFNEAYLATWDMKTGRLAAAFSASLAPNWWQRNQAIEWCGPQHLLLDGRTLYDVARRVPVWNFLGGNNSVGGLDGRHWFVSHPFPNQPATLGMITLPEPEVARAVTMADDAKVPAVLRVGNRVGLQLEFTGPPRNPEGFRTAVTEQFRTKLQVYGMIIDNAAPVRLVVHVDDKETGRKLQLLEVFPRMDKTPLSKHVFPIRVLTSEIWLADAQGKIPISPKYTIGMVGFGSISLPKGESDPEAYLRVRQWETWKSWVGGVGLPYFVSRQARGIVKLPGLTDLTIKP
jgi:hypothetical protein